MGRLELAAAIPQILVIDFLACAVRYSTNWRSFGFFRTWMAVDYIVNTIKAILRWNTKREPVLRMPADRPVWASQTQVDM